MTSYVVFTRLPRPGEAKTRLIPALGAEEAARLQDRMTRQVVGRTWAHAAAAGGRFVVAFTGGDEREMRDWLGAVTLVPQGDGDLGARMRRVIEGEFRRGSSKVIVVGSDCPRLDESCLAEAGTLLDDKEIVLGPAEDGGYYLIGASRPGLPVFDGIPWGTGRVFQETLEALRAVDIDPGLLPRLPDVDEKEDIEDGLAAIEEGGSVSVIIPALDEAENLARLLPALSDSIPLEILVADGGSSDDTIAVAESHGARAIRSERGRGAQMNAAAREARGEFLLFLHADTLPPQDWEEIVVRTLLRPGTAAGAFRFGLETSVRFRRAIEFLVGLRCRLFRAPYGDQGIFVRRRLFDAAGGFPEWPILEDVEIVERLAKLGKIATAPGRAVTSPRRWREQGWGRTFFRHQLILIGHRLGWEPERLARIRKG